MTSFESTKNDIVDSDLGKAVGMSTDTTWTNIVAKIKAIATIITGKQSVTTTGKYGIDTTYGAWVYIPTPGYYSIDHCLNVPWDTLKSSLGTATAADVYTGKTFTSQNGTKVTGTMPGFTEGGHSSALEGKWGINTSSGAWMYIPQNGWYSNKHWLQIPWANLKSALGDADAAKVLNGYTFTSQNGVKVTGTFKNGIQIKKLTVTSSADTYLFHYGNKDSVYMNWFYAPIEEKHVLCGAYYRKYGISSGGKYYALVSPDMTAAFLSYDNFIDLSTDQANIKTSSKPWFPCWEGSTKYEIWLYYVNA